MAAVGSRFQVARRAPSWDMKVSVAWAVVELCCVVVVTVPEESDLPCSRVAQGTWSRTRTTLGLSSSEPEVVESESKG